MIADRVLPIVKQRTRSARDWFNIIRRRPQTIGVLKFNALAVLVITSALYAMNGPHDPPSPWEVVRMYFWLASWVITIFGGMYLIAGLCVFGNETWNRVKGFCQKHL